MSPDIVRSTEEYAGQSEVLQLDAREVRPIKRGPLRRTTFMTHNYMLIIICVCQLGSHTGLQVCMIQNV